jgi:NarL family two-component system response regulator LiaR
VSLACAALAPTVDSGTRALRVAVLSQHPIMRAALSTFLSYESSSVTVVEGPLGAGDAASHDVVVYDLADDSGHSLEALSVLLAEGVPVVALTSCGRAHAVETALALGVAGTVRMDVSADGLLEVLQRAAAGQVTTLESDRRRRRDTARAGSRLTAREVAVLELVGAGMANQEIADRLYVSINTVKSYIRSAYGKIGVTRRPQAVLWVVEHDLARV